MPEAYGELARVFDLLEAHYRDMQDIEFTVERGKLWMLQTRSGKRTAKAALKMAVDMAGEGLIDEKTAILRVDPMALDQLLHPTLDPASRRATCWPPACPLSPGAASGRIVLDADTAETLGRAGREGDPGAGRDQPRGHPRHARGAGHPDRARRHDSARRGGGARHGAAAASRARAALSIDLKARTLRIGRARAGRGRRASRSTARPAQVMAGEVATIEPELAGDFGVLMEWADRHRRMKVRTNAETPADCRMARQFGAEGIGLCRTEHMFFDASRISAVRQMILAEDEAGRRKALAKLLPEQRADFAEIFRVMAGLPVHHPPARSAAARIPAAQRRRIRRAGRSDRLSAPSISSAARRRTARIQPDARPSRLPARHHLSRDLRDAGARDLRGGVRGRRARAMRRCPR